MRLPLVASQLYSRLTAGMTQRHGCAKGAVELISMSGVMDVSLCDASHNLRNILGCAVAAFSTLSRPAKDVTGAVEAM